MYLPNSFSLASLLLVFPSLVSAVFKDEVGHIDFHHELLGLPQRETTFFHRPRREDKASLLYTLSDVGVLGAVNPSNGQVVWRHLLNESIGNGGGHLRAGDDQTWVVSAYGDAIQAWDAISGRNIWGNSFSGKVKDLEVMELAENGRKDVLSLYEEEGSVVARRIHGTQGSVVWEFRETTDAIPLQVSTNVEKVFVVTLQGSFSSYSLKVIVLDTLTGRRLDQINIGTKGDVHSEKDVMFVGANSAAPVLAWTDSTLSKVKINVLGTKGKQEFALPADTTDVEFHAPHSLQSQPHFLIHSRTKDGSKAEVYHVDLKSNAINRAYELPLLPGKGAFSTSTVDANVYFTRITEDEIIITASSGHGVLARWPLKSSVGKPQAVHTVSEVIRKAGDNYAIRSAIVTSSEDWTLVLNGEHAWSRPEGLSGAVAASWAEITDSEDLAKTLEAEAHSNPLQAYIHRVNRHINDLQHLPAWLQSIPGRLASSILGTEASGTAGSPTRDSFGFNKLVVLATRRGKLYGVDVGNHGKVIWSRSAFDIPAGETWDVKALFVDDVKGLATVRGANGAGIIVKADTGDIVETIPVGSAIESVTVVDSPSGKWLLPIGTGGKVGEIPASWTPTHVVVVKGGDGDLKGLSFAVENEKSAEVPVWTFSPPPGQKIIDIATRPTHDPIASIGRVLGDRSVKYKYLNPNTAVVATWDEEKAILSTYLLDVVSGQVLVSATYEGVDSSKPVSCALSENWYVCSFFGRYSLREGSQKIQGYQVVVTDLYESDIANDRGPLGESASFSSLDPVDLPTGPVLPAAVSKTYILSAPITSLAVSQTRQGITTRQLLAYVPSSHGIVGIHRQIIEPRRPVGRDPTPAELEEGLSKYNPVIELGPQMMITHERDVIGVQEIITSPAIVESTSLVLAYGVDVFGTRVTPSLAFDTLGKGFNKVTLIGTVTALAAGVIALRPMVRKRQINMRWQAPM